MRVCCISGRGGIGYRLEQADIPVTYLDVRHTFDLKAFHKLWRLLRDLQPEVLVTYLPHADLIGRLLGRLAGVPRIVTSVRVKLWTSPRYLWLFIADGLTSFLVNQYHFNSPTIARAYQRWLRVPSYKITIIPNGIPLSVFQQQHDTKKLRAALKIPVGHRIICCVARLRLQKGHHYLFQALAILTRHHSNLTVLLVGDGPDRQTIEQQAANAGVQEHLRFLGSRSDVPGLLHLADLFVLPTLFEGMSNALLEAMAAGKPIVTTALPENQDIITHGVTGLLVPPKDSKALSSALDRLLQDAVAAARLGRAAQDASRHYELTKIVAQYEQFFSRL